MLPNIESVGTNVSPGGGSRPKRGETDKITANALNAYRSADAAGAVAGRSKGTAIRRVSDEPGPLGGVDGAKKATEVFVAQSAAAAQGRDMAELNLTVSSEEREVLVDAFSGRQDANAMSPEEKDTLQEVSERLSKSLDEAIARNVEKRDRVEKAMTEWYAKISNGDHRGPTELLALLRQAAAGEFDQMALL